MDNLYENDYFFRKSYLQKKSLRKTKKPNKKHQIPPKKSLSVLDKNESFLSGGIYSVFNTSEDKPVLIFSFSKWCISPPCWSNSCISLNLQLKRCIIQFTKVSSISKAWSVMILLKGISSIQKRCLNCSVW